jgi:hypothetical protein
MLHKLQKAESKPTSSPDLPKILKWLGHIIRTQLQQFLKGSQKVEKIETGQIEMAGRYRE